MMPRTVIALLVATLSGLVAVAGWALLAAVMSGPGTDHPGGMIGAFAGLGAVPVAVLLALLTARWKRKS